MVESNKISNVKKGKEANKMEKTETSVLASDTIDMLSINQGMKEQMEKMEEEKIEASKHPDSEEPLKVLVETEKEKKDVEKLAESIGAEVVEQEQQPDQNKKKKKDRKSPTKEHNKEEFQEVDVKEAFQEAKKEVVEAKEQLHSLEDSLNPTQRNAYELRLKQHDPSQHRAFPTQSEHAIDVGSQQPSQEEPVQKESSWISEGISEVTEEAKEMVNDAISFVKGIFNPKEEEPEEEDNEDNSLDRDMNQLSITEKIMNTIDSGKERVYNAFGYDKSNQEEKKEEGDNWAHELQNTL